MQFKSKCPSHSMECSWRILFYSLVWRFQFVRRDSTKRNIAFVINKNTFENKRSLNMFQCPNLHDFVTHCTVECYCFVFISVSLFWRFFFHDFGRSFCFHWHQSARIDADNNEIPLSSGNWIFFSVFGWLCVSTHLFHVDCDERCVYEL